MIRPSEVLWKWDEHRWTAQYQPSLPGQSIEIGWLHKPWDFVNDPAYGWQEFATANCDCAVQGEPSVGDWAVTPELRVAGIVAQLAQPKQRPLTAIFDTHWEGVDPGDGQTNYDPGSNPPEFYGGDRIFPGRNAPAGAVNSEGDPVDHTHDRIEVTVELALMPFNFNGTVFLKLFDPDHYSNGFPAPIGDSIDPNDEDPTDRSPDDNWGGSPGANLSTATLQFNAGELVKSAVMTITSKQPGNNFRVAANPHNAWLAPMELDTDGRTILDPRSPGSPLAGEYHTELLTVWRKLWLEMDRMENPVAGSPDGPFDGDPNCNNCDDPRADMEYFGTSMLTNLLATVLVDVAIMSNEWDVRDRTPFIHNHGDETSRSRDVYSEADYWTSQTITAYESIETHDYDPNEPPFRLGRNHDAAYLYQETIRDRVVNSPDPTVAEAKVRDRILAHEVFHEFIGPHNPNDPPSNEGILKVEDHPILYQPDEYFAVTPRQAIRIQEKDFPRPLNPPAQ